MKRSLFAALVALGACTTTPGPATPSLVNAALRPAEAASIRVMGAGTWTPNSARVAEFANTGDFSAQLAAFKDGVTVVNAEGLAFAEWNGSAYTVIKRIPLANIADVRIDTLGASCSLVVQEASDSTFHVFEFTRGIANDCPRARAAAEALNAIR